MTKFPSANAHSTPTSFSDDIRTPFADLGLLELSDQEVIEMFAGKIILDVGSGFEGFARGIFSRFSGQTTMPTVINLNPQFTDWRMHDEYIDGERHSYKYYKQDTIKTGILEIMEMSGEDYDGYFAQRTALAGIVQQLPFADNSFDFIVSTWGFPKCLYDCSSRPGSNEEHQAGYLEIWRTLKPFGKAILAPVRGWEQMHLMEQLQKTGLPEDTYSLVAVEPRGSSLVLRRQD